MPHSADELLRRHARLLSERVVWESYWAEVAQHVLPRSDFFMGRRNLGEKHTEKILDATACLALERKRYAKHRLTPEDSFSPFTPPRQSAASAPQPKLRASVPQSSSSWPRADV